MKNRHASESNRIAAIDLQIAGVVIGSYLVLTPTRVPREEWGRGIGHFAILIVVIEAVLRLIGRGPMPGLATLLVTFVSAALIRVPTFPAVGGRSNDAIPIGYLGTVSCAFFYAVRRWQPLSAPAKSATLRTALVWAAALAVMYCMAAALPVLAILIKGGRPYGAVLWTFPAYFVGGAGAALAYWALRSVSHRASGRYALGVLGGICVYGAVAPVVSMLSTTPIDASLSVLAALVAGGIVGPAIAMDQTVVQ